MKFRAAFPRRTLRSSLAAGAATVLFAPVLVALWRQPAAAADNPRLLPAPAVDAHDTQSHDLKTAVLAGGCFWGVQGVFQHARGVRQVVSGYSGGKPTQIDYESVSTGTTGHAESVQITYDPMQISYGQILRIFFSGAHRQSLYRPARCCACIPEAHRNPRRPTDRFLSCRGLSPGLSDSPPRQPRIGL
jgi:peptide-methionine (S)-S-oxide reductase